jgi:hypothetical protein
MPRFVIVLLVSSAAALGLGACGGGSSAGGGSNVAIKRSAMLAFAQCVRAHGVPNFPDSASRGGGGFEISASQRSGSGPSMSVNGVPISAPAFQAAMQACHSKLPNGGRPPAAATAAMRSKALRFARCMRQHGVTGFPDPQFGTGPFGGTEIKIQGSGIDPRSPAFQSAQTACAPIMGKGAFVKAPG